MKQSNQRDTPLTLPLPKCCLQLNLLQRIPSDNLTMDMRCGLYSEVQLWEKGWPHFRICNVQWIPSSQATLGANQCPYIRGVPSYNTSGQWSWLHWNLWVKVSHTGIIFMSLVGRLSLSQRSTQRRNICREAERLSLSRGSFIGSSGHLLYCSTAIPSSLEAMALRVWLWAWPATLLGDSILSNGNCKTPPTKSEENSCRNETHDCHMNCHMNRHIVQLTNSPKLNSFFDWIANFGVLP